jgi:hypothetical protein
LLGSHSSSLILFLLTFMYFIKIFSSLKFYLLTIILFIYFCGTGAWTQGLHFKPLHQPCFSRYGLTDYLSGDDFEPRSSWSLPPEQLGLQVWATGARLSIILSISKQTKTILSLNMYWHH